ncbi:MAG: hypothetical protein JWR12_568 [Mucilaginibacter sp.]|nr:hypothetical protein [Mucilaginibacter sp.]
MGGQLCSLSDQYLVSSTRSFGLSQTNHSLNPLLFIHEKKDPLHYCAMAHRRPLLFPGSNNVNRQHFYFRSLLAVWYFIGCRCFIQHTFPKVQTICYRIDLLTDGTDAAFPGAKADSSTGFVY